MFPNVKFVTRVRGSFPLEMCFSLYFHEMSYSGDSHVGTLGHQQTHRRKRGDFQSTPSFNNIYFHFKESHMEGQGQ